MEEAPESPGKSLQDQAMEGQKLVEETVHAAHEILASLDEVLSNPMLWAQPAPSPPAETLAKSGARVPVQEQGWIALESGHLKYKNNTSALRSIITAVYNKAQMRRQEGDAGQDKQKSGDLEQLEKRASQLRKAHNLRENSGQAGAKHESDRNNFMEVYKKNELLKLLIDQSRDLIADISMWQTGQLQNS